MGSNMVPLDTNDGRGVGLGFHWTPIVGISRSLIVVSNVKVPVSL